MGDYSITWNAIYSATVTSVNQGDPVVVNDAGEYVNSTLAARVALGNRHTSGIARTPVDDENRAGDIQHNGLMLAPSVPLLGPGLQSPVRVTDAGGLERVASPDASDDVIGEVDTFGNFTFTRSATNTNPFDPGGTDTQVYYNNAGDLATTDQATVVAGRINLVSPIVTGTPVYRVANLDIVSYVTKTATVATTQVNCGTVTIADLTTAAIDVIVRCSRDTANTKRGVWKFSAVVSRNGGGAVLDVLNVGDAFDLTGGAVTCDVNSNDFRVRITPTDSDARKWDSEIRVQVNT